MNEKTAELRDIFIHTTGSDTVTEAQEQGRGSLVGDRDGRRATERVDELVSRMRARYDFESDLDDDDLRRVVVGFFDDEEDDRIAASLDADADAEDVFLARMDLHLVHDADRDAPVDLDGLRSLAVSGADDEACAAELGAPSSTVAHYRRVIEATAEARRANDRYRDEFENLLTDADLSSRLGVDARHEELRDATEDIETDVSF
jgi:hypothetical protein